MRPRVTARTNREAVRLKSDYFSEIGLWPRSRLDPMGWLDNFKTEPDVVMAAHLLNALLFLSNKLLTELIRASIQEAGTILGAEDGWRELQSSWGRIVDESLFTVIAPGTRDPHERRSVLGGILSGLLSDSATDPLSLDDAIFALRDRRPRAIFLVDDYFGGYSTEDPRARALEGLRNSTDAPIFYCAAVALHRAKDQLYANANFITLASPHILPSRYSATAPDSIVWPEPLLPHVRDFLRGAYAAAGIEASTEVESGTALCLAFEYRTTRDTLPLFLPTTNRRWTPLLMEPS